MRSLERVGGVLWGLAGSLRTLADDDHRRPTFIRVCNADEDLAAVTAHTAARTIYLEHTVLRKSGTSA